MKKINFQVLSIDALQQAERRVHLLKQDKYKFKKDVDEELDKAKRHLQFIKSNLDEFIQLVGRSQKFAMLAHYTLSEIQIKEKQTKPSREKPQALEDGWYLFDISLSRIGGTSPYGFCYLDAGKRLPRGVRIISNLDINPIKEDPNLDSELIADGECFYTNHDCEIARYVAVSQWDISPRSLVEIEIY